jgi:TatD DNase family protein
VLDRAVEAGIERILVPGWDVASSERALALAARHAPLVQAAAGIHPHYVGEATDVDWRALESLIADPRCVAVGEIGLDFFRTLSPPDVQREAFERQLAHAAERSMPVIVHDRDAHGEVAERLHAWSDRRGEGPRGVLHAFSGDDEMARILTGIGFLVSFALPVAFRSAIGPRSAARSVAADAFLVETDAPYLGPDRAGRNEPTTVLRVAAEVAALREVEVEVVAADVRRAYDRMVGP